MSGLYSMVAIFLIPFFGAAIANRHRNRALIYGGIAFFGMLLTDFLIMRAAVNEGRSYFEQTMPVSGLWLFLWAAWQLGMLWLVFIIAKNRLAQIKQRRDST